MLDAMKARGNVLGVGIKGLCESLGNSGELDEHLGPLARKRRHAHRVIQLCAETRLGVSPHANVIDVPKRTPSAAKAIANGGRGNARGVFPPIESFFLDSSD